MRKAFSVSAFLVVAALVLSVAGCSSGDDDQKIDPNGYKSLLYMTDTTSGKVYTYDPATQEASGVSLATAAPNAGEIYFHAGKSYVCVGFGTEEGVYRFDPSAANPIFAKIGSSIAAQYIAFFDADKGYVSTYGGGLYSFDPSSVNPTFSAVADTSGMTLQDVVVGSDGKIYVADFGNGRVLRLDPSTDVIEATISARASGTTGLSAGNFGGSNGVFVGNNGGYGASPAGSIDFIPVGAANGSTANAVASALTNGGGTICPSRLVQLTNGNLIATGYEHTYLIDPSGAAPVVVEVMSSGSPFGSMDIAYKDGLVYVPVHLYDVDPDPKIMRPWDGLFILDASGAEVSYSPVTVIMGPGDAISNIAFYED